MANIINSTLDFAYSLYTIPERSSRVGYIQTLLEPIKVLSNAKTAVSEKITKGAMYGVKSLGLHSVGGMGAARNCARKLYEHSGAKSYASSSARVAWKTFTSSEFVTNKLGSTGSGILHEVGNLLGETAEEVMLEQCAQTVFHPLISLLREKAIESSIQGCVGIALDTGVLWAAGGLNIVTHLDKVKKAVAIADKVATCANLGLLAYVYGTPVVKGGKAVLHCLSFKSRMQTIEKALSNTSLNATTKKTLATALTIVLESGGLSFAPNLDALLKDEEILRAMVGIISKIAPY